MHEKINLAIELFKQDKVTLRKAAEILGLKYWEFQEELAKRKISIMS